MRKESCPSDVAIGIRPDDRQGSKAVSVPSIVIFQSWERFLSRGSATSTTLSFDVFCTYSEGLCCACWGAVFQQELHSGPSVTGVGACVDSCSASFDYFRSEVQEEPRACAIAELTQCVVSV